MEPVLPFGIGIRDENQDFIFTRESVLPFGMDILHENQGFNYAWESFGNGFRNEN